jgi:PRC-barrel domain
MDEWGPHPIRRTASHDDDLAMNVSRHHLMGLGVMDSSGEAIGQVVDTWPDDGGWEVELVVVRLLRFGERRMLPVGEVTVRGGWIEVPFTKMQIEDAPAPAGGVHRADDPYRAISYWQFEERSGVGMVTARWRPSSGFFATARPFPTSPSPMPLAS